MKGGIGWNLRISGFSLFSFTVPLNNLTLDLLLAHPWGYHSIPQGFKTRRNFSLRFSVNIWVALLYQYEQDDLWEIFTSLEQLLKGFTEQSQSLYRLLNCTMLNHADLKHIYIPYKSWRGINQKHESFKIAKK